MRRTPCFLFLAAAVVASAVRADRIEKRLAASPGQTLEIDLKTGGAITVRAGADDAVEVAIDRRDGDECEVTVEPSGRGVRIESRYVGHRSNYSSHLEVEARVPHRFLVDLRTMGGDVHLEGLEGRFSGSTMGGELELVDLAGSVDLSTMGGDIRVQKSRLDGKVSTMGGMVRIEDNQGDLKGSSMGGAVTYENARSGGGEGHGRGPVVMSSMGGDVNVEDAPQGAELNTMGGSVHVRTARDHVKAETMGGDIKLERVDGWIDASTMGGRVEATVVDGGAPGRRDVRLESKSGDLRLTVPAGFAMDVDIEIAYTRNSTRRYRVISDFELATEDETGDWDTSHGSPRKIIRVRGHVGGAAAPARVVLRTINGDVYLKRAQ
jgi:DUF4097 and DUF4098 domain-containing protein YvlB